MPVVQPQDPAWPEGVPLTKFLDAYKAAAGARYPVRDRRPTKIVKGPRNPRTCALCDRGLQEGATFKNESHVIPIALGNRRYFSNEECDSCNALYADAHDNHLISAVALQRLLFGVRGREGYISLKEGQPDRSVIRATGERQIGIWRTEGDSGLDFQLLEGNRGRLAFGLPKYRPMCMLQSMLRSAWLLADATLRQRHPYLLRWIKDNTPTPTKFLTYTILEGEFQFAELTFWERAVAVDSALLVLQFVFCNTVIIWPVPTESGVQIPSLLPPFEIGGRPPQVRLSRIASPNAALWDIRTQFEFTYDTKIALDADEAHRVTTDTSPIAPSMTSTPVLIGVERDAVLRSSLRSSLTADHHDPFMWRLRVTGDQFAGMMALEINTQDGSVRFDVKLLPHLVSPADAVATLQFLRELEVGGDMSFRDAATGTMLFHGQANVASPVSGRLDAVLQAFVTINQTFGTNLRYPQEPHQFDWETFSEVTAIIRGDPIERGPGTITMKLDDASALRRALAESPQGVNLMAVYHEVRAELSGTRLDLGDCSAEIVGARISPTDAEADKNSVIIEFENVLERFPRWIRREQTQ